MAENASTDTKKATKPKYVEGKVVLQTRAFNPLQPELLAQAETAFVEQIHGVHGEGTKVTNVAVTLDTHKVGESVTYNVTGEIAG